MTETALSDALVRNECAHDPRHPREGQADGDDAELASFTKGGSSIAELRWLPAIRTATVAYKGNTRRAWRQP
jgi:hypothetical protein